MTPVAGRFIMQLGTDMPSWGRSSFPGFSTHRELLAMVAAGLPPVAALKAATVNAAHAFGLGRSAVRLSRPASWPTSSSSVATR